MSFTMECLATGCEARTDQVLVVDSRDEREGLPLCQRHLAPTKALYDRRHRSLRGRLHRISYDGSLLALAGWAACVVALTVFCALLAWAAMATAGTLLGLTATVDELPPGILLGMMFILFDMELRPHLRVLRAPKVLNASVAFPYLAMAAWKEEEFERMVRSRSEVLLQCCELFEPYMRAGAG